MNLSSKICKIDFTEFVRLIVIDMKFTFIYMLTGTGNFFYSIFSIIIFLFYSILSLK